LWSNAARVSSGAAGRVLGALGRSGDVGKEGEREGRCAVSRGRLSSADGRWVARGLTASSDIGLGELGVLTMLPCLLALPGRSGSPLMLMPRPVYVNCFIE
jgi:hypothetical protein